MRFQNKVALVTASASGIGKATAEILAREGAHLVAADLNPDSLSDLSKSIKAEGGIITTCLLYTSPSPRDGLLSRMPSSA